MNDEKKTDKLEIFLCRTTLCDHVWDGPIWESDDGKIHSATCSKCAAIAIFENMLRLP